MLIALLVFYLLCKKAIRKQMSPLAYLTESAERIAEGHFDETIPNVNRDDEVGVFYKHFQLMQKALENIVKKQEEQRSTLLSQNGKLQNAFRNMQQSLISHHEDVAKNDAEIVAESAELERSLPLAQGAALQCRQVL